MKHESLYDRKKQGAQSKQHKPLRSFKELCEELGVCMQAMQYQLRRKDAPKPVFIYMGRFTFQNSYYEPAAFKAWFTSINKG